MFHHWPDLLPEAIELWPIHLPGRERRISEPPLRDVASLIDAAFAALRELLVPPFALFGHSMGALLSFELARRLHREGLPLPGALAVSSHRAPHLPQPRDPTYHLPREEFIDELRRLDGTPRAILDHGELLDLLLPSIQADFQAVETYAYVPSPPLPLPILAYGGIDDQDVPRAHLEPWQMHTSGAFALRMFEGGHFYVNEREVPRVIGSDLLRMAGAVGRI